MPQERLPMRKIRDVVRLKAGGASKRKIAASLGISATAVGECIRRARRACLSWPLPASLDDERWRAASIRLRRSRPRMSARSLTGRRSIES